MSGTTALGDLDTFANRPAMALQYVEERRGQRGHPVGRDRIARMEAIIEVIGEQAIAITARHLFYLLVGRGAIDKSEKAYGNVLTDLLALRRSGDVAWSAIVDGTRTKTRWLGYYGSLAEAAEEWQATYRRDLWRTNPARCEVWSESRGLLDTINEIAGEFGTTTLGVGGFASASVGWKTAQDVKAAVARGQSYYIFHFGDHDPSGMAIGYTAERDIRYHLAHHEQNRFWFFRVALTAEQVVKYDLPSAPVKRTADGGIRGGHAKTWAGGTTELDALDPLILQDLVRDSIESILDKKAWAATRVAEASERDVLGQIMKTMRGAS